MNTIRIFVVSDSLLFSHGLKNLLTPTSQLEIIGEETDIDRAIERMETLRPDVIIWGHSGLKGDLALEEIHLLKAKPGIKVIDLNLQNNELFVYRCNRRSAKTIDDLIEAVYTAR